MSVDPNTLITKTDKLMYEILLELKKINKSLKKRSDPKPKPKTSKKGDAK